MTVRAGRLAAAGLVVLLAGACTDDGGAPAAVAPTSTTPTTAASTTTTSTTSTVAAPTETTAAGPACPGEAIPAEVDAAAVLDADLDGDGGPEAVTTYLAADGSWHLHADAVDGSAVDEPLATGPLDDAHVLTAGDLDADGRAEVWVQVGTGAATTIVGLFHLDGCDFEPVGLDDQPAQFAVGGTVLLLQGVACGDDTVTHLGATSEDGLVYTTLDLTYSLQGGQLVRTGDESGEVDADDPDLEPYSTFDC